MEGKPVGTYVYFKNNELGETKLKEAKAWASSADLSISICRT